MNCVFFSDGVQKEMVREVGGGRGEVEEGFTSVRRTFWKWKIIMEFELVKRSPKAMLEGLRGVNR